MKEPVLITGSSKGLGKYLALVFAENGYNIIIHGRDQRRVENVSAQLVNFGISTRFVIGDLREKSTIEKLALEFKEEDASILINNAGVLNRRGEFEKIIERND